MSFPLLRMAAGNGDDRKRQEIEQRQMPTALHSKDPGWLRGSAMNNTIADQDSIWKTAVSRPGSEMLIDIGWSNSQFHKMERALANRIAARFTRFLERHNRILASMTGDKNACPPSCAQATKDIAS